MRIFFAQVDRKFHVVYYFLSLVVAPTSPLSNCEAKSKSQDTSVLFPSAGATDLSVIFVLYYICYIVILMSLQQQSVFCGLFIHNYS